MFISDTVKYIGVFDRKTDLFEGQYKIPEGISYNSYAVLDEKIAVFDTVDIGFTDEWLKNLDTALEGRLPDYLIVQHMEPDHSASIKIFKDKYPAAAIVASAKAFAMMRAFFGTDFSDKQIIVSEGSTLSLGKHTLTFVTAPMVHWPEVIVTYDSYEKILFSADAFGKFGKTDFSDGWCDEARRYYIGIVGKYGAQVQALLKKAAALDIKTICPLHGPVLTENLSKYISLYNSWSLYEPEEDAVTIAYASIYGNTRRAAELLLSELQKLNKKAEIFDLARCDMKAAVASAFKNSKLVLASATYNADVFPVMREFINHLNERGYKKRTVAFMENGSWAPMAEKVMRAMLEVAKDITYLETSVKITSALNEESKKQIRLLAEEL